MERLNCLLKFGQLVLFNTMQSFTLRHLPIFRCSAISLQSSSAKFYIKGQNALSYFFFFFFKWERVLKYTKHDVFCCGFSVSLASYTVIHKNIRVCMRKFNWIKFLLVIRDSVSVCGEVGKKF